MLWFTAVHMAVFNMVHHNEMDFTETKEEESFIECTI